MALLLPRAVPPAVISWTENGIDVAECYLSANVGEDVRPLARIASGGELSRVMLAIRTLAAAANQLATDLTPAADDVGHSNSASDAAGRFSISRRLPVVHVVAGTIALVGPSGAGKSSILNRLTGAGDARCAPELLSGGGIQCEESHVVQARN